MALTVEELYHTLGNMISEGVHPDTPVDMRVLPKEPNAWTDQPTCHEPEDVWYSLEDRVFIDEKGV